MEVLLVIASLVFFIVYLGVGYELGAARGRGRAGFMLGLLLGPLGWCLALFLPPPIDYRRPRHRRAAR